MCSVPTVDMSNYEKQNSLHEMFIQQAERTPDKTAVVTYDGQKVSFRQLNEMSDLLSRKLQQLGVKRNVVVGIFMERSLEYTVSYTAILKAGGAYLPLELSYPKALLEEVVKDSKLVAICTKTKHKTKLCETEVPVLLLENNWEDEMMAETSKLSSVPAWVKVSLDDMAYTVYSSGTTGRPKGIQCPHRGAVFSYHWRHLAYPYTEDEREACNIFFVWEMFRPLCRGVPMYIIPDDVIYDPPKLVKFVKDQRITRMLFTPSLMQAIVDCGGIDRPQLQSAFKTMLQIWFCGEVVTTALRSKVAELFPWIKLLNLYSISECHDVSCADISKPDKREEKICTVGKVFNGVHVVVMDENQKTKAFGETGEIFVGGPTLAIGYLNRPELTASRFIATPSSISSKVGSRLYRTGDWGYTLADGSLEIQGRCDSMVKIRGYSIELKAVETALRELPMVSSCSVLAKGEEGSDKVLVAYIVLNSAGNISTDAPTEKTTYTSKTTKSVTKQIRTVLKTKLPFYMIPSLFLYLDRIPLNEASGKLDVHALPDLHLNGNFETIDDRNLSPTEKRVAKIWSKILRIYTVDTEESFFDLGGHSLLAAQFIGTLNDTFDIGWPVSDLYSYPTIKSIAARIDRIEKDESQIDLLTEAESYQIPTNDLEFKLRVYGKSNNMAKSKCKTCNVLVTGGTGFLGAFLINELLKTTKDLIYCLVRETPDKTPLKRIEETFKRYNLTVGDEDSPFHSRVVALKGDVTLENFGLAEDEYNALSYDIDAVIHSAANVNLSFPYHALHRSNVVGTRNVISFCIHHKIKPIHYVSTSDVFPPNKTDCDENCDMKQHSKSLHNGYGQSKWVAEQSILKANRCGVPSVIYRCGNIAGPRKPPAWNTSDLTLLILQGVLITSRAPDIEWPIELTPVDFISKFIISSVVNIDKSNGKIFHLVNDHSYYSGQLWSLLNNSGYEVETVSFAQWSDDIKKQSQVCPKLKPLSVLLDSSLKDGKYLTQQSSFKRHNTSSFMKEFNLEYPETTNALLSTYIKNLREICLLPPKKMCSTSSVSESAVEKDHVRNKVILVTGASSGIGAGIGQHLAMAGAKVILTARRSDRLNLLKEELKTQGADVYTMTMDVCNEKEVAERVDQIESTIGPIDVLINNAGVMYYTYMNKANLPQWLHTVQVNCIGVLNCLAAVLPRMTQRKSGHIINITSDAGRRPFAGLAVYSASKHFVEALSTAMRSEICSDGIKLTCIQPGDVESELRRLTTDAQAMETFDFSTKMKILDPADVANACLFALSQPSHCAVNEILIEPKEAPL